MKKLLIIDNFLPPYRQTFYNCLAEHYDLRVVCGVKNDKTRNKDWSYHEDIRFKLDYMEGFRVGTSGNISSKYKKILKAEKFDCILLGTYATPMAMSAIKYLHRRKIPFILNADGGFIPEKESRLKYKMKRYFIEKAFMWVTSGPFTSRYLTHYGADASKIRYYPFSFIPAEQVTEYDFGDKKAIKEKLGIPYDKVILSIGRFLSWKAFDIILRAVKELEDDRIGYYLVGGEPTEQYLDIKKELNLNNAHFLNFISPQELNDYYRMANVFVLASRHEVWGLVVNEAMANGLPVITSDLCISGIENIKDGENGFLFPTDDYVALASRIKSVLQDETMQKRMKKTNVQFMKEFSLEANIKRHIEIIDEFISLTEYKA